jgi:hypothetical protein
VQLRRLLTSGVGKRDHDGCCLAARSTAINFHFYRDVSQSDFMSKITGQTAAKSVSNMRPLRTYFSGSYSKAIYAVNVINGVILTFDHQFLKNPADNADRGPVSIFSARLHSEF